MRRCGLIICLLSLPSSANAAVSSESITQCTPAGAIVMLGALLGLFKLIERYLPRKQQTVKVDISSLPTIQTHDHDGRYVQQCVYDAEQKSLRETMQSMERNLGREIGEVKSLLLGSIK